MASDVGRESGDHARWNIAFLSAGRIWEHQQVEDTVHETIFTNFLFSLKKLWQAFQVIHLDANIPHNILIYIQQVAMLHSLLYLETALHVSGGISTWDIATYR